MSFWNSQLSSVCSMSPDINYMIFTRHFDYKQSELKMSSQINIDYDARLIDPVAN